MYNTALIILVAILTAALIVFLALYFRLKKKLVVLGAQCELQKVDINVLLQDSKYFNKLYEALDHISDLKKSLEVALETAKLLCAYDVATYIINDGLSTYRKTILVNRISKTMLDTMITNSLGEFTKAGCVQSATVKEVISGETLDTDLTGLLSTQVSFPISLDNKVIGVLTLGALKPDALSTKVKDLLTKSLEIAVKNTASIKGILAKEQNTLTLILQNLSEGVVVMNRDLSIEFVNSTAASILGIKSLLELNFYDFSTSFSSKFNLEQKVAQVFEKNKSQEFNDISFGDKFVKIVLLPVAFNNEVQSVAMLIYDHTSEIEFKRLETEFTAMIVHELRSPLTVVRGTTDMIIKNAETISKEQLTNLLTQMKVSAENMLSLVNDLLDTAKAEVGKLQLTKNYFDVNAIIEERMLYYLSIANERGISLTSTLDKTIGQLNIDDSKIKQVLNNLLSNSLKFTEKGGNVQITTRRDHGFVEIVVADTGKGITDESKAKLFSKFMQFKQKTADKGTGLGLVITKGIIETHGGRIWVEDNIPNGTKFIFTLPLS